MSKEKEQITEESLFKNFSLLDAPVPKGVNSVINDETESVTSPNNNADESGLSEDETKALEETAKVQAESKSKKAKQKEIVEEEPESEQEPEQPEADLNEFGAFAQFLAEQGLAEVDEGEEIKSDSDLAKVWAKSVGKGIQKDRDRLPEDAQKFLEFVDNGGNPSDFHKYYYGDGSFENFDISSEENQKYVIEESLRLEGYTDEEIREELTDLEDLGKLDKKAGSALRKLQKIESEQKQMLLEAQKSYAAEQESRRISEWENFRKGLFEKETIGGFKITPKAKNELWDYMTKPVSRKDGRTQYQIDSETNEDSRYMFAYLLKNKWDVKSLEQQVQTREVSKLKSKLNRYSDTSVKKTGVRDNKIIPETEENPFSGFKKVVG